MNKLNLKKGFTLIELLVVVSIISIISSIIVAVLVDAKIGAKNNRKNELVAQYITALSLYYGEYGEYPEGGCTEESECGEVSHVCLGDDYIDDRCFIFGETPVDYHNENSTVNTQISEFIPGLPSSLDESIQGDNTFVGIAYGCTNENCNQYEVSWVLEGEGADGSCYGGASEVDFGPISICTFATER